MLAKHEVVQYGGKQKVWVGKYKNSSNLLHWHKDCELLYLERGTIDIYCYGKNYQIHGGQAFFILGGEVHSMQAQEESIAELFLFSPEIFQQLGTTRQLKSPVLTHDYNFPKLYRKILTELTEQQPYSELVADLYILRLMISVLRHEETCTIAEQRPIDRTFKELLREIEEKYAYFTFSDAARFMSLSETYFSKMFHNNAGMTFSQYLNYVKVENAVRLLQTVPDCSVTDVAGRCGFDTIRSFNRTFKLLTGYAPKQLPKDYVWTECFIRNTAQNFNPTLGSCELLESSNKGVR